MLRKLIAGAALAGSLGLTAAPATAEHLCVIITITVNGQTVAQIICPLPH